jgi:hypothetical protein
MKESFDERSRGALVGESLDRGQSAIDANGVVENSLSVVGSGKTYSTSCPKFSTRSLGTSDAFGIFSIIAMTSSFESSASLLKPFLFCLALYNHFSTAVTFVQAGEPEQH